MRAGYFTLSMIYDAVDSPANGITLCAGSFAEESDNNVYEILAEFTRRKRLLPAGPFCI